MEGEKGYQLLDTVLNGQLNLDEAQNLNGKIQPKKI